MAALRNFVVLALVLITRPEYAVTRVFTAEFCSTESSTNANNDNNVPNDDNSTVATPAMGYDTITLRQISSTARTCVCTISVTSKCNVEIKSASLTSNKGESDSKCGPLLSASINRRNSVEAMRMWACPANGVANVIAITDELVTSQLLTLELYSTADHTVNTEVVISETLKQNLLDVECAVVQNSSPPPTCPCAKIVIPPSGPVGGRTEGQSQYDVPLGTRIGAGVGAAIAFLLIVGGIILFLFLRKRKMNNDPPTSKSGIEVENPGFRNESNPSLPQSFNKSASRENMYAELEHDKDLNLNLRHASADSGLYSLPPDKQTNGRNGYDGPYQTSSEKDYDAAITADEKYDRSPGSAKLSASQVEAMYARPERKGPPAGAVAVLPTIPVSRDSPTAARAPPPVAHITAGKRSGSRDELRAFMGGSSADTGSHAASGPRGSSDNLASAPVPLRRSRDNLVSDNPDGMQVDPGGFRGSRDNLAATELRGSRDNLANQMRGSRDNLANQMHGSRDNLANQMRRSRDNLANQMRGSRDNLANQMRGSRDNLSNPMRGSRENIADAPRPHPLGGSRDNLTASREHLETAIAPPPAVIRMSRDQLNLGSREQLNTSRNSTERLNRSFEDRLNRSQENLNNIPPKASLEDLDVYNNVAYESYSPHNTSKGSLGLNKSIETDV